MNETEALKALQVLDPVGLEFGRLLVLDYYVRDDLPRRRNRPRFIVECSCGRQYTTAAYQVLTGMQDRCSPCHRGFLEQYGTYPEHSKPTLSEVLALAAERDEEERAERERLDKQQQDYENARALLGL